MRLQISCWFILLINVSGVYAATRLSISDELPRSTGDVSVEGLLVDKIMREARVRNDGHIDSSTFSQFVNSYLDGLMVQFRSKVFNLYRRITCGNGFCEPWNPELGISQSELLQRPSSLKMTVSTIIPWHECDLPRNVDSFLTLRHGLKAFIIVGTDEYRKMSMYRLEGNGHCELIENYNSTASPCFATFDSDDLPLVITGYCHSETENYFAYTYLITDAGLKMTEVLEITNITRIFTVVHGKRGYAFFVSSSEAGFHQTCHLYLWMDTTFVHVTNFSVTFGKVVKHFVHGQQTYLTSTNYDGNDSPVTIWQFTPSENSADLKLYQVLNNCYASDVEPFTVGGLQFLATACATASHNESYLYWWTGTQFLMWQSIAVKGVVSWLSVKLNNDDTVLVAHACDKNNTLHVFELGEGYYYPSGIYTLSTLEKYNSQLYPQKTQYFGINILTTIENRFEKAKFTSYRLLIEVVLPRHLTTTEDELSCLHTVEKTMWEHDKRLRRAEKVLEEIKKREEEISQSSQAAAMQLVNVDNSKCEQLDARVGQMERKIARIEGFSRSHQEWDTRTDQGSLSVRTLIVKGTLTTPNLFVKSGALNGVDLADLFQSVVSKSRDQVFRSPVVFRGSNIKYLTITSTLNGQTIDNLAINGRTNVFTAPQYINSLSVGRLHLEETVNNISLSDVVLKNSRQVIHGKKTIKKLRLNGDVVLRGEKINGVNLRELASRVLTLSGNQRITGPVTFSDVKISRSLNCPTIDGVNLSEFVNKVVTTNTPQTITGQKLFSSNMVIKSAQLNGRLNGLKVPDDFLTKYTSQVFPQDMEIVGNVFVGSSVEVKGTVNGLILSKSAVTRCGNHTITGLKEFKDEVSVNKTFYLESGELWQHFGDVKVEDLNVEELNGINLNSFLSNAIRKSKPQTLKGLLRCDKVIFKDIIANELNGGRLDDLYITTKTNQTIFTPLIFKNDVYVSGPVKLRETATVNGIDVSELPNICVTKSGDQIIRGQKNFHEMTLLQGVKVDGQREDVLDLLLRKAGHKLRMATMDGNVEVKNKFHCAYLNDRHLDTFLSQIYMADKSVSLDAKLFDKIVVKGDLHTKQLNGVNVDEFFDKIIRLSSNQVIDGSVKFVKPVTCYGSVFTKTVNGLNLEMQVNNIVKDDGKGTVHGLVTFRNGLEVKGDVDLESLNGWNFTSVMDKILMDTDQYFDGTTVIVGDVVVGDMRVTDVINGLRPSEFVLLNQRTTLHNDVTIKAPVAFSSLSVLGTVKIPLEGKDSPHFKHLKAKHVVLKGTLNDIRVEDLPSMVLSKTRPQNFSTNAVIFEKDVSIDHLTLKRPIINGIDINEFRLRAFTKDTRQTITGKKTWSSSSNTTMYGGIEVTGNVTASKITSGYKFDVVGMNRVVHKTEVLRKGGVYDGDLYIYGDVNVKGLINNLDIERDVVLRDRKQELHAMYFDGDVEVDNLIVDGLVNGINLKHLIDNRITLSTDQTIKQNISFHHVIAKETLHCSDMEVSPSEIKVQEDVTFTCPVVINSSVNFQRLPVREQGYRTNFLSYQQPSSECSRCFRNLLTTAKRMAGYISHFELVNKFIAAHDVAIASYNGSAYVILATPTISPVTCNNVKTYRCRMDMKMCYPTKGLVKLPTGFISRIFSFTNGNVAQAYVTKSDAPKVSGCIPEPSGIHVFRGVDLVSMKKEFVSSAMIADVIMWHNRTRTYIALSNAELGYGILEMNHLPKVIGEDSRRVLAMASVNSQPGQQLYFLLEEDYKDELLLTAWLSNTFESGPSILVKKGVKDMAVFRVSNATYFALAYDSIKICVLRNSTCTFTQDVNQSAKSLKAVEYFGRVYMIAVDDYEVVLYKWGDLLGFTEATKISSIHSIKAADLLIHLDNMYVYISRSDASHVTTLYKGHVFGNNLIRDCRG